MPWRRGPRCHWFPRIEIPPSMPSRGLSVLGASSLPAGTETTTRMPLAERRSPPTLARFSRIILLGTGFIAGRPISSPSPGLCDRADPVPSVDLYPSRAGKRHVHHDLGPVRDVGIVPAVLDYGAPGPVVPNRQLCSVMLAVSPLGRDTSTLPVPFWLIMAASPRCGPCCGAGAG